MAIISGLIRFEGKSGPSMLSWGEDEEVLIGVIVEDIGVLAELDWRLSGVMGWAVIFGEVVIVVVEVVVSPTGQGMVGGGDGVCSCFG